MISITPYIRQTLRVFRGPLVRFWVYIGHSYQFIFMEIYAAQYKRPHSGWCSATNCLNQRGTSSGISFFMFPASPDRCRTWAINAGRPDLENRASLDSKTLRKNNALCEEHFHKDQFMCPAEKGVLNKRKRLMPKAIPTLFAVEATKPVAGNNTFKVEEPSVLKQTAKTNGKLSTGKQLVEVLMAPECDGVTDPDILLSDLVANRETDSNSGSFGIMKAVADSGDTYLAVPLTTDESPSDRTVHSEIIAGNCPECAEPSHSDPSEVVNLKHLVKRKVRFIQRLKMKVRTLQMIKHRYETPEGIIKLASSYLEEDDLVAFASKLRGSKRHILTEKEA